MCRTEREIRPLGREEKGDGVFSIAPVGRREWKGEGRKKERERESETARNRDGQR